MAAIGSSLLITNALIVDGSGDSAYPGRVAVTDGRIVAVGPEVEFQAERTIDAEGRVVAPGLVDTHTHDDLYLFHDPMNTPKLRQGVTTVVTGNCGLSAVPYSAERKEDLLNLLELLGSQGPVADLLGSGEFGAFLDNLDAVKLGMNVVPLVGHTTLRLAVMGADNRPPDQNELETMKALTGAAMDQGAFGLSLGLLYPPGAFAANDELTALCRVAADRGGLFATHMRNESNLVLESIQETLAIAREARIPVVVSHHKVGGRKYWGLSRKTLAAMEDARASGLTVHADQYPYTAASTYLAAVLPPQFQSGGPDVYCRRLTDPDFRGRVRTSIESTEPTEWENVIEMMGYDSVVIASSPSRPEVEGRSVAALARDLNQDPLDLIFDILISDKASTGAIYHMMGDEDLERIMSRPYVMIGSDGIPAYQPDQKVHPRLCGTFPRVLGRYVREKKCMKLEETIRRMTSLPATVYGLPRKGRIKPGFDADLVIFNPDTVMDTATFENPQSPPEGIHYVLVGGGVALEEGALTTWRGGRVLRHGVDDIIRR